MTNFETLPSEEVYTLFQKLVYDKLGIHLAKQKRMMLGHRLLKRVKHIKANGFSDYFRFISHPDNDHELEIALELMTTNETFFFREEKHFEYMAKTILPNINPNKEYKVWSAASSSGEEPYSIAMLLNEHCSAPWSVVASDVNKSVLAHARKGIYIDDRTKLLPHKYREAYCVKGTNEFEGYMRVKPELRNRLHFFSFNLLDSMSSLGKFDLIFIRNVMIYFDDKTRQKIINGLQQCLNEGGYLFISHSETLHGLEHSFELIKPAIYRC
ncbi:CheR family methyltransferase [Colwellia psychrerythraea]|uniref:Chemotaxis protein methyltransferase n=1 Tax=Colwellia psychrerythraea TaxID=28229 RepID=A0A099KQ60_COLPS|nr:CheR family methyltransferase [Colwellia psychrerythraea]KGJ91788.1 MCP methyltransferase, CheR-type [Colwellia psychrerythraea]